MYTPISVPPSVRFTAAVLISALLCVAATDARSQDRPDRPFRPDRRPVETEPRSIDGSGNNTVEPLMGAAETVLVRVAPSDYADGLSELAGADRAAGRNVVAEGEAAEALGAAGAIVDGDATSTVDGSLLTVKGGLEGPEVTSAVMAHLAGGGTVAEAA